MLDFNTLQVASISSRLAFVLVFFVTLLRHPREIYFGIWAGALCCSLTASILMLGDPPSVPLNAVRGSAIYVLYGASLAVSWVGLRLFHERTPLILPTVGLALFSGLSYGILLQAGAPMSWSLIAVFACTALSTALCIWEILRTPASMRLWTQYIVLAGFCGYFCVFILTIGVVHFASERLASPESGVYSLVFDLWCGVFIQVGYLAMVSERAHLKLIRLADTDWLTGLANRRGLFTAMSRRAGLSPSPLRCAILMADIDHFKAINDTYGHDGGDAALVGFAERLRGAMRKDDLVARWGGEEFLVVLDQADATVAAAVAERLRKSVAGQPFTVNGASVPVTASIGVAFVAVGEERIDAALSRADAALYDAKRAGRNRVCLEPPPPQPDTRAARTEPPSGLREAMEVIQVVGQPRSELA
ncbi:MULTISPECIES: GGDEF domain-containing protein [Methylobacteriaceae]|uniref:GGDEF domain-containing protein n=1 Tax=Methylobacteriaceae TaxID=119045 RepID=UPI00074FA113|nr:MULTISPECIES: GGDEF domain-containing protein [Methylobacteriaceae]AMB44904.1 diguanylate cyclase [Methylobacterium sp. AMS5]TFZ59068.1 diguanylate cyclase [Methylorubrum sp. Q1]